MEANFEKIAIADSWENGKPVGSSGFLVEAPEGVRFMIRSRLFTDAESAALNGV